MSRDMNNGSTVQGLQGPCPYIGRLTTFMLLANRLLLVNKRWNRDMKCAVSLSCERASNDLREPDRRGTKFHISRIVRDNRGHVLPVCILVL